MIKTPTINYKEIFDAWKISHNPTIKQEELAKLRLNVCLGCEFRKEIVKGLKWSALCGKCGCPLNKKVFSPNYNACPIKLWGEVDSNYLEPFKTKDKNTLI
jgi:hypothetical protein